MGQAWEPPKSKAISKIWENWTENDFHLVLRG